MQNHYFNKASVLIKITYWSSLFVCLLSWLGVAFIVYGLNDASWIKLTCNFFAHLLEVRFVGRYLGAFTLLVPVVFVITSIKRRKIFVSELLVIVLTWILVFYVYTHGHT